MSRLYAASGLAYPHTRVTKTTCGNGRHMKLFIAGTVLGLAVGLAATCKAQEPPVDDNVSLAHAAGVDPIDLAGASNSTGLSPTDYLRAVGELAIPDALPRGVSEAGDRVQTVPGSGRVACIVRVESRGDPDATNPQSGAAGLGQFLRSTWRTTPQGKAGLSPYNAAANLAAIQYMLDVGRAREFNAVSMGYC